MKKNRQQGFTLIELIMVIVILGILAATALPKFVDLSQDAHRAHADAVLGASKSAAAMNYGKTLLNSSNTKIITGATLLGLLDVSGWAAGTNDISATLGSSTYTINITAETATASAGMALVVS